MLPDLNLQLLEASFIVMMGGGLILLGGAFLLQRRTIDPVSSSLIVGAGVYAILWKEPVLVGAAAPSILPLEAAKISFFLLLFGAVFLWVYWLFERHVESLERTRDALVASVERSEAYVDILSHDIRNPLTVAKNRLALQAHHHPELLDGFGEAQDALDRIERIIQDALAIAGGEDTYAAPTRPVPLARIVEDRRLGLEPLARQHDVELRVELGTAAQAPANQMLGQAVENLVANAIAWAPAASHVDIGAEVDETSWHLLVRDRGPGIDVEEAERLFDRFQRGEEADHDGVGLGLAITKRLAEMHGGTVAVEQPQGPGCVLRLSIPLDWPAHGLPGAAAARTPVPVRSEPGGVA